MGAAQSVRRRFDLEVGAVEESVTVSGESPLINTASTEQRINLDPLEIKALPAANRNLTNLLNIGTGLTRQEGTVEGGGSGSGGAGGIRLRLNGLGGAAMSITANGTDASANAGARQISQYNGISKIDIVRTIPLSPNRLALFISRIRMPNGFGRVCDLFRPAVVQ